MWTWIQDNNGALSVAINVLMLCVWLLYFHLLYTNYRHQTRPKILINRGAGQTVDARCVISNMSEEAVYIEAVIVSFGVDVDSDETQKLVCSLSDLDVSLSDEQDPRPQWLQGPLKSGELIDVGSYRALAERAIRARAGSSGTPTGLNDVKRLEIMVVASYTAQDGLVAAERVFDVEEEGDRCVLKPHTFSAHQIRRRRERKAIERMMLTQRRGGELRDEQ